MSTSYTTAFVFVSLVTFTLTHFVRQTDNCHPQQSIHLLFPYSLFPPVHIRVITIYVFSISTLATCTWNFHPCFTHSAIFPPYTGDFSRPIYWTTAAAKADSDSNRTRKITYALIGGSFYLNCLNCGGKISATMRVLGTMVLPFLEDLINEALMYQGKRIKISIDSAFVCLFCSFVEIVAINQDFCVSVRVKRLSSKRGKYWKIFSIRIANDGSKISPCDVCSNRKFVTDLCLINAVSRENANF